LQEKLGAPAFALELQAAAVGVQVEVARVVEDERDEVDAALVAAVERALEAQREPGAGFARGEQAFAQVARREGPARER
jgi:hypothetical protein